MVNITYFIVKEVRNYDCGPWLCIIQPKNQNDILLKSYMCQKFHLNSDAMIVQEDYLHS